MYVNSEKNKAVMFSYTMNSRSGESFNRVKLQGLDPAKIYKIQEINAAAEERRFGPSESGKSRDAQFGRLYIKNKTFFSITINYNHPPQL
jgi:hypothetical protein